MKKQALKSLVAMMLIAAATPAWALKSGDQVPDVTVASTDGGQINLRETGGQWTVLFFYPKAFTPGCTKQACGMRDGYQAFLDLGVRVLGASVDSVKTQKEFKAKHNLPFELLADEEKDLARGFGSLGMVGFASRKTYIINPEGIVTDIIGTVSVGSHDEDVLNLLRVHLDGAAKAP